MTVVAGFFSNDPKLVRASVRELSRHPGERLVSSTDIPWLEADEPAPGGLWSEALFGDGGWAYIKLPEAFFHPGLIPLFAQATGLAQVEVAAIAERRAIFVDGAVALPAGHPGYASAYVLDDWPPSPELWCEELWSRDTSPDKAASFSDYLAAWQRDTGVDLAAVKVDEDRWQQQREQLDELTGVAGLRAAFKSVGASDLESWFTWHFPVLPRDDRPRTAIGGVLSPGPINSAYRSLTWSALRCCRLIASGARETHKVVLDQELRVFREDHLLPALAALREQADAATDQPGKAGWSSGRPSAMEGGVGTHFSELGNPQELAFVGDHVLLDFPSATVEFDLGSARVMRVTPTPGLRLLGTKGTRAYFAGDGYFVYDYAADAWRPPESLDAFAVTLGESSERAYAINRAGQRLWLIELADYLANIRYTPCLNFVLAADKESSGALYDDDGLPVYPTDCDREDDAVPTLQADGRSQDYGSAVGVDRGVCALAYDATGDRWLAVAHNRLVISTKVVCELGFPINAAAFDSHGQRLLVASTGRLLLLRLEGSALSIEQCWDLRPLQSLFVGSGIADAQRWHDIDPDDVEDGTHDVGHATDALEGWVSPEHLDEPIDEELAGPLGTVLGQIGTLAHAQRYSPAHYVGMTIGVAGWSEESVDNDSAAAALALGVGVARPATLPAIATAERIVAPKP